jgi:AmmeMemoRadiSam system protein B
LTDRPRILGPDGREARRDEPLLVDAHGRTISSEGTPGPPERPQLRALDFSAVQDKSGEFLVARDPLGVCDDAIALRLEVLPLLQLMDGTHSTNDIVSLVVQQSGDPNHETAIRTLVDELDRLYLLESPRFEARRDELAREYREQEVREPVLAGSVYPDHRDELEKFLGGQYAEARAVSEAKGAPAPPENPEAIAVPHLDLRRGGVATALGFLAVPESPAPDLVILFGTGHSLYQHTVALTDKTFRTPLGDLASDRDAIKRIVERSGETVFDEETAHKQEHSIEFAALHLAYRFGTDLEILPLLCGGFHRLLIEGRRPADDPLYESVVAGLREEVSSAHEAGRRVLLVAAVDLSHVGARFGDTEPLEPKVLEGLKAIDENMLAAAATGSADAWFDAVAAHNDSTRICGFSALHCLLAVANPGPGTVLRYEQSVEPEGSVVTIATLAWQNRGTSTPD